MSPKSKQRRPQGRPTGKSTAATAGKGGSGSGTKRALTPTTKKFPLGWVAAGGAIAIVAIVFIATSGSDSGSDSGTASSATSAELVARTKAADVPLLEAEAFETHTHTTVKITVNGKAFPIPAGIGIDEEGGRIAALHTHDGTGLVHVESPNADDSYTLDQFLTVWGMPAGTDARCAFFDAASPCTITVTSKESGAADLDTTLADNDTLQVTVTSN